MFIKLNISIKEKHRNDIEIDFLLTTRNKVSLKLILLKVKSSKSYKVGSMKRFIEKFEGRIDKTYIINPKNLSIREDGIICIPAYMAIYL